MSDPNGVIAIYGILRYGTNRPAVSCDVWLHPDGSAAIQECHSITTYTPGSGEAALLHALSPSVPTGSPSGSPVKTTTSEIT